MVSKFKLLVFVVILSVLQACSCLPYARAELTQEKSQALYQAKVLDRDIQIKSVQTGLTCKY